MCFPDSFECDPNPLWEELEASKERLLVVAQPFLLQVPSCSRFPAAPGKAVSACWWWRVAATGWQQSLSAPPVALTQHIYWGCSQLRPAKFSEIQKCRSCSLFSQYSLALAGWGARHLFLSDFWGPVFSNLIFWPLPDRWLLLLSRKSALQHRVAFVLLVLWQWIIWP